MGCVFVALADSVEGHPRDFVVPLHRSRLRRHVLPSAHLPLADSPSGLLSISDQPLAGSLSNHHAWRGKERAILLNSSPPESEAFPTLGMGVEQRGIEGCSAASPIHE